MSNYNTIFGCWKCGGKLIHYNILCKKCYFDSRCTNCGIYTNNHQHKDLCNNCYHMTNKSCEICNNNFIPINSHILDESYKLTSCKYCWDKKMIQCEMCSNEYIVDRYNNFSCNNTKMQRCNDCAEIYNGLMSGFIDKDLIHKGVLITIWYEVTRIRSWKNPVKTTEIKCYPHLKEIENTNPRTANSYELALYDRDNDSNDMNDLIIYRTTKGKIFRN